MIRYLKHNQINKSKWDESIRQSLNGLVYAQSWYLDIVSPGWEALVEDDYDFIMPLTFKKKWFIPYLFQPSFAQQLGVFSKNIITGEVVLNFMDSIPRKFLIKDFNVNSQNIVAGRFEFTNRSNYELDLRNEYATVHSGYNENTKRNIRKAKSACFIENYSQVEDFVYLFSTHAKKKIAGTVLNQLKQIVTYALDNQIGEIKIIRNVAGSIIAGAFFLKAPGRIIYLVSFTCSEGSTDSPMFFIIDEMVKEHAAQPWILDFEGSMIPGIARFFAGFGAKEKIYQRYKKLL